MIIDRVEHDRDTAEAHLLILGWEAGYGNDSGGIYHPEHGYVVLNLDLSTGFGSIRARATKPWGWKPVDMQKLGDAAFWNIINYINRRLS